MVIVAAVAIIVTIKVIAKEEDEVRENVPP